jgi:hypothetical protein
MKRIVTIAAALMMTANVWAQVPEKMSYQAVVRDAGNALVTSTAVGMQISILQGGATGTAVYVETQSPTANANGLVSLEIGTGTLVSGDFSIIDWANDTYFIKTETDPTGGSTYTITGTSQLMSVPYALYAKTSGSSTPGPQGATGANGNDGVDGGVGPFHLGKDTLGGIVYYIYIGSDGNQHGLIVNKNESTAAWQTSVTTTSATRSWDGVYNTGLMTSSPAATYVNGLTDGGFTDWYLPSVNELSLLWHNLFHANNALNAGSYTILSSTYHYWSSTEGGANNAFSFYFNHGTATPWDKTSTFRVRAVRAF